MTTLAEQVAEVKVGDWVRVRAKGRNGGFFLEGKLDSLGDPTYLELGHLLIRSYKGEVNSSLTSITRVPRPIPSEPGFGHFALLKVDGDFDIAKNYRGAEYEDRWAKFAQDEWLSWPEIYPHITRLYTPSGDEVTGFEYAGGDK